MMARPYSLAKPARQRVVYRQLYRRVNERLDRLDDSLSYLLVRIKRLEARLDEDEHDKTNEQKAT